jgi:hypothetical protein
VDAALHGAHGLGPIERVADDHDEGRVELAALHLVEGYQPLKPGHARVDQDDLPDPVVEGGHVLLGLGDALVEDLVAPCVELVQAAVGVLLRGLDDKDAQGDAHRAAFTDSSSVSSHRSASASASAASARARAARR